MLWVDIYSYTQLYTDKAQSKYVQIIKAVYISFLYSSIPYRPILIIGAPLGHPSFKVVGATALLEELRMKWNHSTLRRMIYLSMCWVSFQIRILDPFENLLHSTRHGSMGILGETL